MRILGLQKLTLLDYPGKLACTVFTGGCNFRCPFCHNASLVLHAEQVVPIPQEQVYAFLQKRAGMLEGVCVSGGEPLLQSDLEGFLAEVKQLGYAVKLDTNGSSPERLKALVGRGLVDYVAMDVKNTPDKYAQTAGIPVDISAIQGSITYLLSGAVPCEFRTTLVRELHDMQDVLEIGRWLAGSQPYFLQAFEDSGDLINTGFSAWSAEQMHAAAQTLAPLVPCQVRGI